MRKPGIPEEKIWTNRLETIMRNARKILIGMLAAAGLAAAGSMVYADPPGGFGPGSGGCAFGVGGPGMGGGYGPGMMGYGGGPRGGYGPGMMGGGPRGGYGAGAGYGPCAQGGPGSAACDGTGPGAGYGAGPRGGYGPGAAGAGPAERVDARLAFLKDQLKITSEQEAAWDAYAKQAKTQVETMAAFHAQGPIAAETPAERIEQHAARMKLRADQAQAASTAVKELFAVLTPEQKTIANQHFGGWRMGQAGPRGYGRGRWN